MMRISWRIWHRIRSICGMDVYSCYILKYLVYKVSYIWYYCKRIWWLRSNSAKFAYSPALASWRASTSSAS